MRWSLLPLVVICLWASDVHADKFCNSSVSEPAINTACLAGTATGPNNGVILVADDFEDGDWAQTDCDGNQNGSFPGGGGNSAALNYAPNDGWCMNVFYPHSGDRFPGQIVGAPWYVSCGGVGAAGSLCTARSGLYPGGNDSAMQGEHQFKVGGGVGTVPEFYMRVYHKPYTPSGYFSDLKWWTINVTCCTNGIQHGDMNSREQEGTNHSFAYTPAGPGVPDIGRLVQNQGNELFFIHNHWYYVEFHLIAQTAGQSNGTYELWVDDCGTDGLGCTGPGTLRARYTNVITKGSGGNYGIVWLEMNGKATQPTDSEFFWDQFVVSTKRIGPVGVVTPPPVSPPLAMYLAEAILMLWFCAKVTAACEQRLCAFYWQWRVRRWLRQAPTMVPAPPLRLPLPTRTVMTEKEQHGLPRVS